MTHSESRAGWRAPPALGSLTALWGFAVAQPLYDLLRAHPEFFIEHGTDRRGVVLFAAALSVFIPVAMAATVEVSRRLSGRLGQTLQLAFLGVLAVALGALVANRLPGLPGPVAAAAAALLGAGGVAACYRWSAVHSGLSVAAAGALLIFPAAFLAAPAIRGLWLPASAVESFGGGTGAPVVILVLDELPLASLLDGNDRIEARRFPSFADLAGTSSWYRNATSISTSTAKSVTSLLTGSPHKPGVAPTAAQYPRNLFTALGVSYDMHVVERVTRMCPAELCPPIVESADLAPAFGRDLAIVYLHLVTPEAWRSRLAAVDQNWGGFGLLAGGDGAATSGAEIDPRTEPPLMFRHFIASIEPRPAATLHYMHLMLPHVPWKYLPTGQEYARPETMNTNPGKTAEGTRPEREWQVVQAYQRHLLQVELTDRLLGDLLGALRQHRLFDRALLILTSDHGATFALRRAGRRHGPDGRNVPLIVKLPGQRTSHVVDRSVTLLDVLPTVLDVVELAVDWPMEGAPLTSKTSPVGAQAPRVSETRRESVRRKLAWFPDFAAPGGLYRIGRYRELIGRRPESRPAAADSPLPSVELDRPWFLHDVDPAGPLVPAYLSGRLVGSSPARRARHLAIAVNGRIAGVTRAIGGGAEFSTMVEPSAFSPGSNRVDVYQILERPVPSLVLLPDATGDTYRLARKRGKTFLSLPGGRRVRVRSKAEESFTLARTPRSFLIAGKLRAGAGAGAPLVLLFDGTRTLGPIPADPDRASGPAGLHRFRRHLPLSLAPDPDRLRVVVVRNSAAWSEKPSLML